MIAFIVKLRLHCDNRTDSLIDISIGVPLTSTSLLDLRIEGRRLIIMVTEIEGNIERSVKSVKE